jgi:hypothetical protein
VKFRVPIDKGNDFPMVFFEFIAGQLQQLLVEYQKWPNKVTFLGQMGKELFDIIKEKEWDFDKFNLSHTATGVEKILIEYDKPLDEIEETGYLRGDSIHGQTMNGIPGSDTIGKLKDYSLNTSFRIERKIRPKIEIKLIR